MTLKNGSRPSGHDEVTIPRPVDHHSASLFAQDAKGGGRPTVPVEASGAGPLPTSEPNAPAEPVAAGSDEARPAAGPFDMDALIRSKREKIEPRPNLDPFDLAQLRLSQDFESA